MDGLINKLTSLPWFKYWMGDISQWVYFSRQFKIVITILFIVYIVSYIIAIAREGVHKSKSLLKIIAQATLIMGLFLIIVCFINDYRCGLL